MNALINARETVAQDKVDSIQFQPSPLTRPRRWLSFAELAVGTAIVIGHNVYHVVPNEVPILFVLGLLSMRLRDGSWTAMGLGWPKSWRRTFLFALAAAALRLLLGALVIEPITAHFWPPAIGPSGSDQIRGHAIVALEWLLLIWTFAAFGEEIGYRGYLLTRAAEAGGRSKAAYWAAVIVVAVLFGYGHYLQRSIGSVGFRDGWPDSWGRLRVVGTQPVGLHFGPRIH
jgi:uncharacterized protein